MSDLLKNKKGLILGIVNQHSIAYSIADYAAQNGAELAVTYQAPELEKKVAPLCDKLNCNFFQKLNVLNSDDIIQLADQISKRWDKLDFIVHSLAFSDKDELRGQYLDTSLANFQNTMNISCYSLVELSRHLSPLMTNGGSILTMTYYGSQKVIPNYNVMGVAKAALETSVKYLANDLGSKNIRVNAISAGPIRTLAASAISDIKLMIKSTSEISPLRRNTSQEDVAKSSVYLLSDLSCGVTGEIHYVDCGYNIIGSSVKENAI